MAWAIETVDNSGGTLAYHKVLADIKALAEANGWTTQRWVNTGDDWELILKGEGLSGQEEIFVGFKAYHSVTGDYYNIAAATMVGYVPGNTFEGQPGISISGVPCHNNAVTYYIALNAQRITGCFKVGIPVYEHFYQGKFFPYARRGEYPLPLVSAGMFNGAAATRFSDTVHSFPWKAGAPSVGSGGAPNMKLRTPGGTWVEPRTWPWQDHLGTNQARLAGDTSTNTLRCIAPLNGQYTPLRVVLYQDENVFGELDGVFQVSGWNNGVENVLQVGGTPVDQSGMDAKAAVEAVLAAGGRAFVVLQDVYRTAWRDFIALEMT